MLEQREAWLGIDLGTQSVRVLAVTSDGTVVGRGSAPLTGHRKGDRHEQDAGEWWRGVCTASRQAMGEVQGHARGVRIGGLAVCGTSGTVVLTDVAGRPMGPALMYDDGRAGEEAARVRAVGVRAQDTWALPKAVWLVEEYGGEGSGGLGAGEGLGAGGGGGSGAGGTGGDGGLESRPGDGLGTGGGDGSGSGRGDGSAGVRGRSRGVTDGSGAGVPGSPPRGPQGRPRYGRRSRLHLARPPRVRLAHQPDTVVARLTGEPSPTDSSHALKTGYDLEHDAWPYGALTELGLPDGLLPDVVRPGTRLGEVCAVAAEATGIPAGTPVIAGMTDGCAAQIASGALRPGAWNSVLGTTLVLKGAAVDPLRDPTGVVYNHRAPDGTWLPGGASSVGAGVLTAAFAGADPAAMDARAAAHEPSGAVTYPLVSPGERFPFRAPQASSLLLGEPRDDADLWAALLQGVAFTERLCLDYLHHLGAPLDGPLTFTGGGARSPYWNQLRADILGRPARVPAQTEPALGMAALAAYGTGAGSLVDITDHMVRIETALDPRPSRTALFAEPYARLVDELTARGWLPTPLAHHAHARLRADTGGGAGGRDTPGS